MSGVDEQAPGGRFAELVGRAPTPVTPVPREAQPYQGHRAGIVTRFLADAIDFVVLVAILAGIYASVNVTRFLVDPSGYHLQPVGFVETLALGAVVLFCYLTGGWWLTGRTYGKHVMGLRLLGRRGGRPRLLAAALRAAICVLAPITLFWVVISPANRSVADIVVRSSVVYDWEVRMRHDEPRPDPAAV